MPIPTPQQFYAQQTVEHSLAFCSVNTTNSSPESEAAVWEWAAIIDGVEHTWQTRLSPDVLAAADSGHLDLYGFHERYDPETALEPDAAVEQFSELVAGRNLVTLDNDAATIETIFGLGVSVWLRPIDVQSAALTWLVLHGRPIRIPWTVDDLIAYLDVDFPDRYSAIGRARWVREVWSTITRP